MSTERIGPAEHLAKVRASFDDCPDPRLREVMRSLIEHLHGFVTDVGLTGDEWMAGIQFLTETGRMSDDDRQEFILLSDTLGVSMLVVMLDQDAAEGTTEPTVLGPFHRDGAPERAMGDGIDDASGDGEPLVISGVVADQFGAPIEGAELDVWQNQANGLYDVQDAETLRRVGGMNMRGIFRTGADGRYEFRTVRPLAYSVPDDGPVGRMLAAAGRKAMRPGHTHMIVSAPGHKPLTTHLFDSESDHLDTDAVFGVRPSLIVDLTPGDDGVLRATFDVTLETHAAR